MYHLAIWYDWCCWLKRVLLSLTTVQGTGSGQTHTVDFYAISCDVAWVFCHHLKMNDCGNAVQTCNPLRFCLFPLFTFVMKCTRKKKKKRKMQIGFPFHLFLEQGPVPAFSLFYLNDPFNVISRPVHFLRVHMKVSRTNRSWSRFKKDHIILTWEVTRVQCDP